LFQQALLRTQAVLQLAGLCLRGGGGVLRGMPLRLKLLRALPIFLRLAFAILAQAREAGFRFLLLLGSLLARGQQRLARLVDFPHQMALVARVAFQQALLRVRGSLLLRLQTVLQGLLLLRGGIQRLA